MQSAKILGIIWEEKRDKFIGSFLFFPVSPPPRKIIRAIRAIRAIRVRARVRDNPNANPSPNPNPNSPNSPNHNFSWGRTNRKEPTTDIDKFKSFISEALVSKN